MNKITAILILCFVFLLVSCRDSKTKTDTENKSVPDTSAKVSDEPPVSNPPVESAPKPTHSSPDDILINIDKYLVSTPSFDAPSTGEGITNGLITVQNKLNDASFQKTIIEVSILLADGKTFSTNYYTIVNVEPGGTKLIKIPNTTHGVKIVSHVVKIKSNELTKGESIVVGKQYVPK